GGADGALSGDAVCDEDSRRWTALGDDQSRSHGSDWRWAGWGQADEFSESGAGEARRLWSRVRDCAIAARSQSDLGGQRYWADSRDSRWREELERCDSGGSERLEQDFAD